MILHIVTQEAWDAAVRAGEYRPASLAGEGFIHCSTAAQVLGPANEFYRGQTGLVLLVIDPALVEAAIVYEDCYETGQAFPHIYGPLSPGAVTAVIPFPPDADGSFSLPPAAAALAG
jgi:uncharacterized protein (DUF952 family)